MNRSIEEKVQWYEEILATEPTSKIFFPLAKLYIQNGNKDKALTTLREGLNKHPEHIEARLLLSQTLEQEDQAEAQRVLSFVISLLKKYPEIWKCWSRIEEEENNIDLSLALRFVGLSVSKGSVSWAEILRLGFQGLKEKETYNPNVLGFEADIEDSDLNMQSYKTRTMADILASQGDYAEAISIYTELLENNPSQIEKERLEASIQDLKDRLENSSVQADSKAPVEETDLSGNNQAVIKKLERLASRLEKKGQ